MKQMDQKKSLERYLSKWNFQKHESRNFSHHTAPKHGRSNTYERGVGQYFVMPFIINIKIYITAV